jgi:hypothetical protein
MCRVDDEHRVSHHRSCSMLIKAILNLQIWDPSERNHRKHEPTSTLGRSAIVFYAVYVRDSGQTR